MCSACRRRALSAHAAPCIWRKNADAAWRRLTRPSMTGCRPNLLGLTTAAADSTVQDRHWAARERLQPLAGCARTR
eukprot:13996751-Alexandrium_andersonii.AAC.1